MKVAAALGASAVARCDWVVFVDVQRRCGRSLAAFGVEAWLLADVGRWRQGGTARWFERRLQAARGGSELCGWLQGMLGVFGACWWCVVGCGCCGVVDGSVGLRWVQAEATDGGGSGRRRRWFGMQGECVGVLRRGSGFLWRG